MRIVSTLQLGPRERGERRSASVAREVAPCDVASGCSEDGRIGDVSDEREVGDCGLCVRRDRDQHDMRSAKLAVQRGRACWHAL